MTAQNPARATDGLRVPSHGQGLLMPAFGPGNNANPGGRPKSLKDVQKLARNKSMDALHALIGVYTRPDGKIDRSADGRMVVAAAQTVLTWAYGKPPDYDPNREQPETKIDLSSLNVHQRRVLLETLARVTTVVDAPAVDDGPQFDPTRFAEEPMVIDGEPVPNEPIPGKPKPDAVGSLREATKPKAAKPLRKKSKPKKRRARVRAVQSQSVDPTSSLQPPAEASAPQERGEPEKRKRGRPRTRPLPDPDAPRRPPGRPRKVVADTTALDSKM